MESACLEYYSNEWPYVKSAMRFLPIVFAVREFDGAALHADEPYGLHITTKRKYKFILL